MGYYKKNEKQLVGELRTILKNKGFGMGEVLTDNLTESFDTATDAPAVNRRVTEKEPANPNPIGMISSYFEQQGWHFEQFNDNELLLDIAGEWCRYRFYFSYIPARQFFYLTARIELPVPEKNKGYYSFLLQGLNESMRLGHIDLSPEDQKPVWRFLLPLRGGQGLTLGQLADILEESLYECDKIYPAFQLFVWGGYSADEAISSILFPVMGSA